MAKNNGKFTLENNSPSLFEPTVIRGITNTQGGAVVLSKQNPDAVVSNLSSSFKFDPQGFGLKNTQQLNVDWSLFENHTFFNSAQVKTNVAFQKIIESFPFDGSRTEVENFFDSLTGFEKWVYDTMPKNKGYLFFSGTNGGGTGGTYVIVNDLAGAAYPQISSKTDGTSLLMPEMSSMTIEFWVYLPSQSNDNQIILDKINTGAYGYGVYLNATGSSTTAQTSFHVLSGAFTNEVSVELSKGTWNHLAFLWNRTPGNQQIFGYVNQELQNKSDFSFEFGNFPALSTDLLIGSGSGAIGTFSFVPDNTLSGALDELRIWHSVRTQEQLKKNARRNVFAEPDLKLYYRLNEPSGSQTRLVLDQSSNSLHGELSLSGYVLGVRNVGPGLFGDSPLDLEKNSVNPVLFPRFPALHLLQTNMLISASLFDADNPNLITRLVPPHYFLEGQAADGFETEETNIVQPLLSGSDPKTTDLGDTTAMLSMLYLFAKYFDEVKLYTQEFSNVMGIDYDNIDTVPDAFLADLAKREGIDLPPLFVGSSIEQYIDADDIQDGYSTNELSLQQVQNQIWRRILINLKDVMKSKGTIYSIKSFLRDVGIEPDNNFRIREYGGPTRQPLSFARETRSEAASMLNFLSGGLIQGAFLSALRVEPGFPAVSAAPLANNGIFTSGSWTYEGTYKLLPFAAQQFVTQSLVRLHVSNSLTTLPYGAPILNLLATPSGGLTLRGGPGITTGSEELTLNLSGANIFDGDQWYVSFGKRRNDDGLNSVVSSSFFIRAAKQNFGEIVETYENTAWLDDRNSVLYHNPTGAFLMVGSQSLDNAEYLVTSADPFDTTTEYRGKLAFVRFWTKYLKQEEWLEHVRNPGSLGVKTPAENFNFVTNMSGSWGRLRVDASMDQMVTQSSAGGAIDLFDFSQNELGFAGTSFAADSQAIDPELFYYSYISPKYDEGATVEKIRVRSYLDYDKVLSSSYAETAPVYSIRESESPTDSTKFSIDFSIVDSLDQDIVKIFATLDELDNAIGSPELLYSLDYPRLDNLREVYFNRLTDRMNLKSFFEFYKWFDTNIGSFIDQLVPHRAKYNGTNFVVESHMLERAKYQYKGEDAYLGESNRGGLKDTILVRLIVGNLNRY